MKSSLLSMKSFFKQLVFLNLFLVMLALYPGKVLAGTPDDYGIAVEGAAIIESDTTWSKDQIHEISQPLFIVNGATLTIDPGTEVKFKDSDENNSYSSGTLQVVDGSLRAEGTERDWIRFSGETLPFSIEFDRYDVAMPESLLRYVQIGDGQDVAPDSGGGVSWLRNIFFSKVFATASGPTSLHYWAGRASIENTIFANKENTSVFVHNAAEADGQEGDYFHISNSNFENLDNLATISSQADCPLVGVCQYRVRFQNNWYGRPGGPDGETFSGPTFGITYRTKPLIADPVIIVPGILGSMKNENNSWVIDPVRHTYDDLLESLKMGGYEENINLFTFPYDWLRDNRETATLLGQWISNTKAASGVSRVDLLAHSMGGLVSRQYIEGDNYNDDVDQLITLGTPHRGSPDSYLTWEGGEFGINFDDKLYRTFFKLIAIHQGYSELHKFVKEKVPTVGQLLPDYAYLYDVVHQNELSYPSGYPSNLFLENLNLPINLEKLQKVRERINIVGKIEEEGTINKIRVLGAGSIIEGGQWEHGIPEGFGNEATDQGLEKGDGDGTVPLSSAQSFPYKDIEYQLTSKHNLLPDDAQCDVFKSFTGANSCILVDEWRIVSLLNINIFSPIDVQIVSPSGKRIGKDFETGEVLKEIPGAFYSGYNTETEFVTIPNPEDGEYKVLTQGVGAGGEYRVEVASINEDPETGEATQTEKAFEGVAEPGIVAEEKVEILDEEIVIPEEEEEDPVDVTAPLISITEPEAKEYLNSSIIIPEYTAADETSSLDKVSVVAELDEEESVGQIDLSLLSLGGHSFEVSAADEAGNLATEEVVFTSKTSFVALRKNISHYGDLGLIKTERDEAHIKGRIVALEGLVRAQGEVEKLPKFFRSRALAIIEREIQRQKTELYNYLSRGVSGGRIDLTVTERIKESTNTLVGMV